MEKYIKSDTFLKDKHIKINEKQTHKLREIQISNSLEEIFDKYEIKDGYTISFHHHLRNGDNVMNKVLEIIYERNIKNITLAPSSIFPSNSILYKLIENQNVTKIHTNYLNGVVSDAITKGLLKDKLYMYTHGGRNVAIERGDISIDVAFLATPIVDKFGNGSGKDGKNSCGALGYGESDMKYAKKVVLVTDTLTDELSEPQFLGKYTDDVVLLDSIGEKSGIVSGTTKITKDPVGLKIARDCAKLLDEIGLIKDGFTMQTGAGGTSLAVCKYVKDIMKEKGVKAKFVTGGITSYFVEMLNEGLVDDIYDVQCFDLDAVKSYSENPHHHGMSASFYANPFDENCIVNKLDFVILGATEIDLNFNVNVTTDSHSNIIGGSGGHSDTAYGANVTVITTNLIKSRMMIVKDKVTTVTTPGETVDVLVTERGIAINPKRVDLLEKLKDSKLNIMPIEKLYELAQNITGVCSKQEKGSEVVGYIIYRDGRVIDYIYKKND